MRGFHFLALNATDHPLWPLFASAWERRTAVAADLHIFSAQGPGLIWAHFADCSFIFRIAPAIHDGLARCLLSALDRAFAAVDFLFLLILYTHLFYDSRGVFVAFYFVVFFVFYLIPDSTIMGFYWVCFSLV